MDMGVESMGWNLKTFTSLNQNWYICYVCFCYFFLVEFYTLFYFEGHFLDFINYKKKKTFSNSSNNNA